MSPWDTYIQDKFVHQIVHRNQPGLCRPVGPTFTAAKSPMVDLPAEMVIIFSDRTSHVKHVSLVYAYDIYTNSFILSLYIPTYLPTCIPTYLHCTCLCMYVQTDRQTDRQTDIVYCIPHTHAHMISREAKLLRLDGWMHGWMDGLIDNFDLQIRLN